MNTPLPIRLRPTLQPLCRTMQPLVRQWKLWRRDDPVGVAVSGGKDSTVLLWLLSNARRCGLPMPKVVPLHVPPPPDCPCAGEARALPELLVRCGLPPPIVLPPPAVPGGPQDSPGFRRGDRGHQQPDCARCARERRHRLLEACLDRGIGRIALGHHQDDLVETLLLNLFFHGRIEATMSPDREYAKGRIHLIRPLLSTPARAIIAMARRLEFPPTTVGRDDRPPENVHGEPGIVRDLVRGERQHIRDWLHSFPGRTRRLVKENLARIARLTWPLPPPDAQDSPLPG